MARGPGRPRKRDATDSGGIDGVEGGIDGNKSADSNASAATDAFTVAADAFSPSDPAAGTGSYSEPVAGTFTNAATAADNGTVSTARRGRPPGSRNSVKTGTVDISGVEVLLLGIHNTLAAATSIPEIEMNEAEAHKLASAYADVCRYYPVFALDPKVAAVLNLGSQVSLIYGSKIVAYRMRRAMEGPKPQHPPVNPAVRPTPVAAPQTSARMPDNQFNGKPLDPQPAPPSKEQRTARVVGIGEVEFPADHPLLKGRAN